LPYYIRKMTRYDIEQVTEIDHEAFPTMWPPANYKRELEISIAHYIVACNNDNPCFPHERARNTPNRLGFSPWITLTGRGKGQKEYIADDKSKGILGFGGIWIMVDEAHITNIAVRREYQRMGIGEQLLIAMINIAIEQKVRFLTLEVRPSNMKAQKLYQKYGFTQIDIRHNYYTDNREDALVMIVDDICGAEFQKRIGDLKTVYSLKWGVVPPALKDK